MVFWSSSHQHLSQSFKLRFWEILRYDLIYIVLSTYRSQKTRFRAYFGVIWESVLNMAKIPLYISSILQYKTIRIWLLALSNTIWKAWWFIRELDHLIRCKTVTSEAIMHYLSPFCDVFDIWYYNTGSLHVLLFWAFGHESTFSLIIVR